MPKTPTSRSGFTGCPLARSGDFSLTAFVRKILFAVIHHIFSDHGQSFPLISFLPFKAIFDIYCRNFQNEKRFWFRGVLFGRPKKIVKTWNWYTRLKVCVNKSTRWYYLRLKDHIKKIFAGYILLENFISVSNIDIAEEEIEWMQQQVYQTNHGT